MIGRLVLMGFIGAFVLESWLFLVIGGKLGLTFTLLWILGTFVLGIVLIRVEGLRMLFGIHTQLQRGVLPTREVLNGMAIVSGGALLLLPGYFTDTLGVMLLAPPVRSFMLYCVVRSLNSRFGQEPPSEDGTLRPSEEVVEITAQPVTRDR